MAGPSGFCRKKIASQEGSNEARDLQGCRIKKLRGGCRGGRGGAQAQDAKTPYPSMAPLDQYLMERAAEIAMARSAAPESISKDAEVMVLGPHGYETAVKGKNGFVCMVERGWTAGIDDPEFLESEAAGPALSSTQPAARSYVPLTLKKTDLILAGRSKDQMSEAIKAAFDKKELPAMEPGAMCYMLSKQGYLNDQDGHWHPHLMFFVPTDGSCSLGCRLAGLSGYGSDGRSGPIDLVSGSGWAVVGWDGWPGG